MASGKNLQHGTYSGSKAKQFYNSHEYNHELHVKMCKKIAQLTKVIHALNLKIDEYEVNILALKEAHQDKIDLISTETRENTLQYESSIGETQNLRLHIQTLEEALEKSNMIKEQALGDLTMYKKQAEEKELKTIAEHSETISALSKEMLSMKSDYECRLQQLTEEADSLKKECKIFEKNKPFEKINEELNIEVQSLSKELENLKTENHKLTEEYTLKTSKLHSSYSKERENLRKVLQQSVTEMIKQLQQKEQEQKKCTQVKEAALQQELKQLQDDTETKTQEIKEINKHSQKMKERIQELEKQLKQRSQEVIEWQVKQTEAEEELSIAKDRLLQQENEIHTQTEQMKNMSSTQKAFVNEIAELKSQLLKLQQKTLIKTGTSKKDNADVLTSNKSLKEYTVQKQETMKQHREEISKIKRQKEEEKRHLKEQLVKSLEDLANNHAVELKAIQSSMEMERIKMQKEYQIQMEGLKKKYICEINELVKEREALCVKLQDFMCKDILQQSEFSSCLKSSNGAKESGKATEPQSKENERYKFDPSSNIEESQFTMISSPERKSFQVEAQNTFQEQEKSSQIQMKKVNNELDKYEKETSRLEKENLSLKDSVEQLNKEITLLKQDYLGLQETQIRTNEELKLKKKAELDSITQSHRHEIQSMVANFSSAQGFLQAKIVSLESELKEMEGKANRHPRPEDLQLIHSLQDKLTDKEHIIKHLMELQKYENLNDILMNSETHRSQSFSCNPNSGSLTPTLKKKKIGEIPTRVISVPNLAAYEKTFLNHELMSKRVMNPLRNSRSLDHSAKPGYPFKHPAQLLDVIRPNRKNHENKPSKIESKDQEPKRPEWFTKYFSF
ncbi:protein FAM184B [Rhinophrynus dorsalis]